MNTYMTRRGMLKAGTALSATALLTQFQNDVFANHMQTLRVRQNVTSLDPAGPEIAALKAGVAEMKRRTSINQNDPLGWRGQALIHQNFCPHGNFFFLPWHRAYLYYFEQLCREASGNTNFTLPYWEWSSDRSLPGIFFGNNNPLNNTTRSISQTSQASLFSVGQNIIDGIIQNSSFTNIASSRPNPLQQRRQASQGTLEATPHNYIHGWVGGNMATFMSPLDACFWLHHANIDRIWAEWTEEHPNGNISDADWRNWNFANNFVDTSGMQIPTVTVESMLSTYDLGYRYNTQNPLPPSQPSQPGSIAQPLLMAEVQNNMMLTGASPLSTAVDLSPQLQSQITEVSRTRLEEFWNKKQVSANVMLQIDGVKPPSNLDVVIRVFINCNYLSRETPALDPHYVGSIAFFEHAHHEGHGNHGDDEHQDMESTRSYTFDLTRTLQTLASVGAYNADATIEVQLLPVPLREDGIYNGEISIGKYVISYSESSVR